MKLRVSVIEDNNEIVWEVDTDLTDDPTDVIGAAKRAGELYVADQEYINA